MGIKFVNLATVLMCCILALAHAAGQFAEYPREDAPRGEELNCKYYVNANDEAWSTKDAIQRNPIPAEFIGPESKGIRPQPPINCQDSCKWEFLSYTLLGTDGIHYMPVTGVISGSNTLVYQSRLSCTCRNQDVGCISFSPVYDNYGNSYIPKCQQNYTIQQVLVWPNFPVVNHCSPPVWKYFRMNSGCCCRA